ncbi:VOC family protein, partial [Enterobacter hormaechei]
SQGLDKPHPAGEVTLQSAIFEVQDPQAAREHWHALFGFNELSEGLSAGQQRFLFRQGEANRLVELVFNASDPSLKGQRFRVGRGEYRFQ